VDGYPGFEPDAKLPRLEDFLSGVESKPVKVMMAPGRMFLYSGGGYTVLQLAFEEITGQPYSSSCRRMCSTV
jgi:CubicO group peptidase (beta-lactamase class C family)